MSKHHIIYMYFLLCIPYLELVNKDQGHVTMQCVNAKIVQGTRESVRQKDWCKMFNFLPEHDPFLLLDEVDFGRQSTTFGISRFSKRRPC